MRVDERRLQQKQTDITRIITEGGSRTVHQSGKPSPLSALIRFPVRTSTLSCFRTKSAKLSSPGRTKKALGLTQLPRLGHVLLLDPGVASLDDLGGVAVDDGDLAMAADLGLVDPDVPLVEAVTLAVL